MPSMTERQYDLVLLGATGFTGKLTAEYIANNHPPDLQWAVAGRNHAKLVEVADGLRRSRPDHKGIEVETTDLSKASLDSLVRKARVIISTIGPYYLHGTPVLEACANAGTHYLNCTGETPWVYDVAHRFHERARSNGAILIPQCAMDSAPADLAAYMLASYIRNNFSTGTTELVHSIQSFTNEASGGTIHSLIGVAGAYSLSHLRKAIQPTSLCVDALPALAPPAFGLGGSRNIDHLGLLTDSFIGIPDSTLVYRSWSLMDTGKYYGGNFRYFTGMRTANRITGLLWHLSMLVAMPLLLLPPVRWFLLKVLSQPGEGPSKETQAQNSTIWKSIARSDSESSKTVILNMSYDRDMYSLTATLLAEAAMVLLRPDQENWTQTIGGGVLTPATLGNQFIEKVKVAGLNIDLEVL